MTPSDDPPQSIPGDRASNFTVGAGAWVHYDFRGPNGAPRIVLLPPLGGSGELFEPFRENLARDHRVITFEPPGTGASGPVHGLPSTRALAVDLLRLFDSLGVQPATLFGISLGGMIAQWIAILAPERVTRLILASTAARGLTPAEALSKKTLALARCLFVESEPGVALVKEIVSDDVMADSSSAARLEDTARAHPHRLGDFMWLAAAAAAHDTRGQISSLRMPTLIITGTNDDLIPPRLQGELASSIAPSEHRFIEGAGHDVAIDRPLETAALVRAFAGGSLAPDGR